MQATPGQAQSSQLKRVLRRWDMVLLFVVAIVNLNVVPTIAANGLSVVWLWLLALLGFFLPQGIAVIELSQQMPGEGGIYLWAKHTFGDFHGFLSGWCYWTNNIFYLPTVLLYFVGISVFVAGPGREHLADNPAFALTASLILFAVLTTLNVLGLGVGKWVNNLGGIGTAIAAVVLIGLGIAAWIKSDGQLAAGSFVPPADIRLLSAFGVICFGLVGLELASVMGDEIKDSRRDLPAAVAWGGVISAMLYVGATLTLLIAIPREQVGVLQGVVQAVDRMATQDGVGWILPLFALVLSVSVAGIASAWLGGMARVPFVAGLDGYLPEAFGKLHPRYATPYVAIIVQAVISAVFLVMSFIGAQVKEAFITMLDLAVVLQLVPFLYIYAALIKISLPGGKRSGRFSVATLRISGAAGFLCTVAAMSVAFIPSRHIDSIWLFEAKMIFGTLFFIGMAAFFFYSSQRRAARVVTTS